MDARKLAALDHDEYQKLVTDNMHPPTRNPEIWAALTDPGNLQRTRDTLTGMYDRVISTMRRRRAEREAFQEECFSRGPEGKKEWFATRSEYERWRHRATNFHRSVQSCLTEIKNTQKRINRAGNDAVGHGHRETLRKLALAVQKHQAAHARAGGIAEQHDYELWRLLDRLTVPTGPASQPTTLRTMLDIYWTDVVPLDAGQEQSEALEGVMRAAPAGQSSRFAGTPRARHVGSDRKLA